MEFSKQENVSRQSSILKLPKHRQPLQCVAANPSSSENSPTIKIKRRVSFARNRRIREFCNEAEPESVWDDTYEEHDLSSTKSNCSNTNEHPVIISVPCDDKENFPVQLFLQNDQLECKEIQVHNPNKEKNNLLQNDEGVDYFINNIDQTNVRSVNEEENEPISTIFYDDIMNMTSNISTNIVSCQSQEASFFNDTVPVSQIFTEIAETLPLNSCRDSAQSLNNKKELDVNIANSSDEFTKGNSSLLEVGNLNKLMNQTKLTTTIHNLESFQNKENCSNTVQMEFSSILPSSTWLKPDNQYKTDGKNITSSEILKFSVDALHTRNNNLNIDKSTDLLENMKYKSIQEKTTVFSEKPMKTIEKVPIHKITHQTNVETENLFPKQIQNNTKNFSNQLLEIPGIVSVYNRNCQYDTDANQALREENEEISHFISNIPKEVTQNVLIYESNHQSGTDVNKVSYKTLQNQDKISTNKSLETVETISTHNMYYENNANTKKLMYNKMEENTKYFNNKSMEISETVPIYNKNYQFSVDAEMVTHEATQEKTKIFSNNTMEFTELIERHKQINKSINEMTDEMTQSKTKIFIDKSMEITDAVLTQKKITRSNTNTKQIYEIIQNNDKIFTNKSLGITESIPMGTENQQINRNPVKILNNKMQEKTKIFSNKSMEITETIPICNINHESENNTEIIMNENTEEKTKNFSNNSMEITEAVLDYNKIHQYNNEVKIIPHKSAQNRTKIFTDKSMTETVAINCNTNQNNNNAENKINKTVEEKTNIFFNNSMELTEAVPIYNKIYQCDNNISKILHKSPCRSKNFYGKPLESNESFQVNNGNTDKNLQELLEERVSIVFDESIKNTELSLYSTNIEQSAATNATNFCNNLVPKTFQDYNQFHKELFITSTEKLLVDKNNKNNIPIAGAEHLKIITNKSLNTYTESIAIDESDTILEKRNKSVHEKVEELSKSFDVQKTIPTYTIISEGHTDDRKFFCDKSVNIKKTVPISQNIMSNLEIEELSKNKDQDNSMDITENIDIHQICNMDGNNQIVLQENEDERTKIFLNNSMDITETIDAYNKNVQSILPLTNTPSEIDQNTLTGFNTGDQSLQNKNVNMEIQIKPIDDYNNTSMEKSYSLSTFSSQCKTKNYQPIRNSIQIFHDISMEDTLSPTILLDSTNNLTKLNEYTNQSILSNKIDAISNSLNISKNCNKTSNYETSNRFSNKEESFHRITSDELNTLCASMNLPAQRHSRIETTQDHYIPLYNDPNILNDSLKDSSAFQQQPIHKNNIISERNITTNSSIKDCENINKENNFRIYCDINIKKPNFIELDKEKIKSVPATVDFIVPQKNHVNNYPLIENNFDICSNKTHTSLELITNSLLQKEINKTDIMFEHPKYQQTSNLPVPVYHDDSIEINKNLRSSNKPESRNNILVDYISDKPLSLNVSKSFISVNNENNHEILSTIMTNNQKTNKISINEIDNIHNDINLSMIQRCDLNNIVQVHETDDVSDKNTKISHNSMNTYIVQKNMENNLIHSEKEKFLNSKIQIYHDNSIDSSSVNPLNTNKKFKKTSEDCVNNCNITPNLAGITNTSTEIYHDPVRNKNDSTPREHSLTRIQSDNTDVLLATMGFKTELSHPLIINNKTTIKVSSNHLQNKTCTIDSNSNVNNEIELNKVSVINLNAYKQNKENVIKNIELPIIENNIEKNTKDASSDEANKESSIEINLFPENYSKELEEIEPPSFLCSDSFQENSIEHIAILNTNDSNILSDELNEKTANFLICENEENNEVGHQENYTKISTEELKRHFDNDSNNCSEQMQNKVQDELSLKNNNCKQINELIISKDEKNIEPLTPSLLLVEDIKKYEKRSDCIWSIRTLNQKLIVIDFITKSFIVIINLNEIEKSYIKDIKDVEFISLLSAKSKNILLKTIHNLLLLKLKPSKILEKYQTYEHIIPLLDYISNEVIFTMNFMFDLQRIKASHLLSIDRERITFIVASRKVNIILKVSVAIKIFNEIGPNDVDVTCVLGDTRKSDIMQLIINIKKDYKFLSRYINDIKDYITLMEESTFLNKH